MKSIILSALIVMTLGACSAAREHRDLTGAAIGGVGGAIIGGAASGTAGGAVIGGVIGAAGGALVADATRHHRRHHCYYSARRDRNVCR